MNQLTKAQLTVGLLADLAIVGKIIQQAQDTTEPVFAAVIVILLIVPIIVSIVVLGILEKVKIFDLKTNSILTLIVIITSCILFLT